MAEPWGSLHSAVAITDRLSCLARKAMCKADHELQTHCCRSGSPIRISNIRFSGGLILLAGVLNGAHTRHRSRALLKTHPTPRPSRKVGYLPPCRLTLNPGHSALDMPVIAAVLRM